MSCTANALPAKTPSMYPALINSATELAAPVCTIAGPPTMIILPPAFFV